MPSQDAADMPASLRSLIVEDANVVPEATLVDVAKGPLARFISTTKDYGALESIWSSLFKTFSSPSLIPSHRTAICNAISTFMESSVGAEDEEICNRVLSKEHCMLLFEAYLDMYEHSKPKPMRQVLNTLGHVLGEHASESIATELLAAIPPLLVSNIILSEPKSRLKASLLCLEWFIRKGHYAARDVLLYVREWLSKKENYKSWGPLLSRHFANLNIPLSHYRPEATPKEGVEYHTAQILTTAVLLGGLEQDILPSAGSFISVLCHELRHTRNGKTDGTDDLYPYEFSGSPFWSSPLRYIALQNLDNIKNLSNHVFFPIFKSKRSGFQRFIDTLPLEVVQDGKPADNQDELILLFHVLEAAKELGIVHEDTEYKSAASSAQLPSDVLVLRSVHIGRFILHPNPTIRLSALSLLITAPSTTKPFSISALEQLQERLPLICSDSDPQYRGEVFSIFRKLVIRFRGGLATLEKKATTKVDPAVTKLTSKQSHLGFIKWLVEYLLAELHPAASYQRHIFSLKALTLLAQTGLDPRIERQNLGKIGLDQASWTCSIDLFTSHMFQCLGNLLGDSFEDVRASAQFLLGLFPRYLIVNRESTLETTNNFQRSKFAIYDPFGLLVQSLLKAEDMASKTSRADDADAVARLYRLVFDLAGSEDASTEWFTTKTKLVDRLLTKLESHVSSTEEALFHKAMREKPFHGYVAALRFIVSTPKFYTLIGGKESEQKWEDVHERILSVCNKIWAGVKEVLCVDSPEGQHDDPSEELVGPKDVLSCSWRALRESSLLLHAILSNTSYAPPNALRSADYSMIGDLSFTQLAELRHRGAFSTVAQTFATCCLRCGASKDAETRDLPKKWYCRIVQIIHEQSGKLTRRSAGLPALVTGVAGAQPDGSLLSQIITDMQKIGASTPEQSEDGQDVKLPQVHALNSLKDLFTNTRFGPLTEPHIPSSLQISANCLGSPIWAIRNCGLMLFRALLIRMCRSGGGSKGFGGDSGAEPGGRIIFENWGEIVPLLEGLLKGEEHLTQRNTDGSRSRLGELSISTERVFPALELIGEKAPASNGKDDRVLRDLVERQLGSPVWGIRDQAARIYASLIKILDIPSAMEEFVSTGLADKSENEVHGRALCIRHALNRVWHSTNGHWRHDLERVLDIVLNVFANFFDDKHAPFVLATVLDILNDAMIWLVRCGQDNMAKTLYEDVISPADFSLILHGALSPGNTDSRKSSSLLFRSFIHATLIVHLAESLSDEEPDFLSSAAVEEVDACRWVLEQIHLNFKNHAKSLHARFELYISIIDQDSPNDLKCVAMSNMANELSDVFSSSPELSENIRYMAAWAESADIQEGEGEIWSRELCEASLHLQGCLLGLRMFFTERKDENLAEFQNELSTYAQKLKFAAQDETEFTTRQSAVRSLNAFVSCMRRLCGQKAWRDIAFFRIHCVLYDFLNDDDEDIRDVAAQAASWILSDIHGIENNGHQVLALAASESFSAFMARGFRNTHELFLEAMRRILGADEVKDGLTPVEDQIASYSQESTVLFEEEKQNLFVDEIRESGRWSVILSGVKDVGLDNSLMHSLYVWAHSGLVALTESAQLKEYGGILGWSSKPEVFVLGMRVLYATYALLLRPDESGLAYNREELAQTLCDFILMGRARMVNESWNLLAEEILGKWKMSIY